MSDATDEAPSPKYRSWGFAVRVGSGRAREYVHPGGLDPAPFYWSRRRAAEELAIAQMRLGRQVEVVQALRLKSCTGDVKEPWDEGFDPRVHAPLCGASLSYAVLENATHRRQLEKLARDEARLVKVLARQDAAEKRAHERKEQRWKQVALRGTLDNLARALITLRRAGASPTTDAEHEAQHMVITQVPGAREDLYHEDDEGRRALNTTWLDQQLCVVAEDAARSEPRVAQRVFAIIPGYCARAEERAAKHRAESQAQKRREAARNRPTRPRKASS